MSCPCGTRRNLDACCGRFIDAGLRADTPEALMRSRYTAYVLGRVLYLRESWHPRTRPQRLELDPDIRWSGLEVVRASTEDEDHGTVEFVARFQRRGEGATQTLHEHSRFERRRGAWVYVDGDAVDARDPGGGGR